MKEVVGVKANIAIMKKLNKFSSLILIFCILLTLTGCFRADVGVEIKSDGTGSVTTKLSIEESLYRALASADDLEEDVEKGGENAEANGEENVEDATKENDFDFALFELDQELSNETGKNYYSYSITKDHLTLEDVVDELYTIEFGNGTKVFSYIQIQITERGHYTFELKTNTIDKEDIATDSLIQIPDDWFTLTMTIKMPGEVVSANGGTIVGEASDGTVRFNIDNFETEKTILVKTEPESSIIPLIIVWGIGFVAIAFCLTMFFVKRKKKEKEMMQTEPMRDSAEEMTEENK